MTWRDQRLPRVTVFNAATKGGDLDLSVGGDPPGSQCGARLSERVEQESGSPGREGREWSRGGEVQHTGCHHPTGQCGLRDRRHHVKSQQRHEHGHGEKARDVRGVLEVELDWVRGWGCSVRGHVLTIRHGPDGQIRVDPRKRVGKILRRDGPGKRKLE